MRNTPLLTAGPPLEAAYHEILVPSFPPAELCELASLETAVRSGTSLVWVALDEDDTVVGTAVGDWDPHLRVLLLSWLAVRPGIRGGGIGGPLLDAAMASWRASYDPCLILAEVEDPTRHDGNAEHGDPAARLRFYTRRGARALDLPYFQAALGPDKERVSGLLLMVLHADPSFTGAEPDTIDSAVLRSFIETYQRECEGEIASDDQANALWRAIDRPGGVPLK